MKIRKGTKIEKAGRNTDCVRRQQKKFGGGRALLTAAGTAVLLPAFAVRAPLPAYAAQIPKGTICISNVKDEKAKVTAYQLVRGTYSEEDKLTGYVLVDEKNMPLQDIQHPTAQEISDIADYLEGTGKGVKGQELSMTNVTAGTWSLQAEPGEYLVLVTGTGDIVYNPAVVSVNVTDANQMTLQDGSTDFTSWFQGADSVYMKSSVSDLRKYVLRGGKPVSGCSAAIGEELTFVMEGMTIPSYSSSYKQLVYQISDELEKGAFEEIKDLKVLVDGKAVSEGKDTWKISYGTGKTSFVLSFTDAYLRANGTKSVEIRYTSRLSGKAGLNYAENTNVAVLKYSNDPADASSVQEKTAVTYQYTFGLGANIDQEGTKEQQTETEELNKVTKAGGSYEKTSATYSSTGAVSTQRSKYALEGAEFTLYQDAGMTKLLKKSVSDKNGRISITGLQEGDYYLQESSAPDGYAVNDRKYHISIAASYREDGVMTSYTVTTKEMLADGSEKTAGSMTYTSNPVVEKDKSVTNTVHTTGDHAEILNVPLAQLPSAGGSGTLGFVLAAAGMSGGLVVWKLAGRRNHR